MCIACARSDVVAPVASIMRLKYDQAQKAITQAVGQENAAQWNAERMA